MKLQFTIAALAASFVVPALAQTDITWWHSMTAVNGEWVNETPANASEMAPTLVTSCTTLPPEGAVVALGRPGGDSASFS